MTLVIEGAPRTKKNHGRVVQRGRRRFHVPSEACTTWTNAAVLQLRSQWRRPVGRIVALDHKRGVVTMASGAEPWRSSVNVRALIYRDALRGDAVGFYQAIADALEAAGVVENDRLCVSWDGSRLLLDRARPRVEMELTPVPDRVAECLPHGRPAGDCIDCVRDELAALARLHATCPDVECPF